MDDMSNLLSEIDAVLRSLPDAPSPVEVLRELMVGRLGWCHLRAPPQPLDISAPVRGTLDLQPVAELGGLRVFHVPWIGDHPPGVTARRAVQAQVSRNAAEHLICYTTRDRRQAAFTWARRRSNNRIELRTLPYEVGSPARTTIERLALLNFSVEELSKFPNASPPISVVTDKLDAAFNVEAVTKKFYQEIANWFFWARDCPDVMLPRDVRSEADRSLFFIRLLTRLIFCWFLRKKRNPVTGEGLLPDMLFDDSGIASLLKDPSPDACTYYPAILQNLFFATLNTPMEGSDGSPGRRFIDEGNGFRSDDHMVHTVWRHRDLLRDPDHFARILGRVPFLNGGLFECLDDRVDRGNTTVEVRIDGFSNDPRKRPQLPNYLFFGNEREVDLSAVCGDERRRREKVRPLLHIMQSYNFTLTENTPYDIEVALDPELLGHVFENLLAAYNPETGVAARKATGSFYTPRIVVDWMVDEALLLYLKSQLTPRSPGNPACGDSAHGGPQTGLSAPPCGTGNPACHRSVEDTGSEVVQSQTRLSAPRGSTDNLACDDSQTGLSVLPEVRPFDPKGEVHRTHRRLPHWTQEGRTYFVTFRLADSVPQEKLRQWLEEREIWLKHHPKPWSDHDRAEYDERFGERFESWLDAGEGECHLRRADIRGVVESCLRHFDGQRYDVFAYVVMPNHVHLLICPREGFELAEILKGIKGVSAREANRRLGRTGAFWQEESFDHIVRSQSQFERLVHYIADNPGRARLREGEYSLFVRDVGDSGGAGNPACRMQTGLSALPPRSTGNLACVEADGGRQMLGKTQTGLSAPPGSADNLVRDDLESRLRHLLAYHDEPHQFNHEEVELLINAIDNLKAIDPACGSGAFPMGLLQKLVHILRKLDPKNERWRRRQEAALERIDSAPAREEARRALERAFARDNDDYGRKLYLIENCLYGVDIQPIACQIAKLRCFIALIVDQTIDPSQPNYGILPLPNLETKIVAADTLLGLSLGQRGLGLDDTLEVKRRLMAVRHEYFTARSYRRKRELRKEDQELRRQLAALLSQSGELESTDVQRVADWNPYDTNRPASFFDPSWMFGLPPASPDKGGAFDMVISNPPYIRQEQLTNMTVLGGDGKRHPLKEVLKAQYDCYSGTADLYVYFFERGLQILRVGGVLSYITSNKYLRAGYGERLRAYLCYATRPRVILDFGDAPVFTSIAYPCIFITEKVRHVKHRELPDPRNPKGFFHASASRPPDWQVSTLTWRPEDTLERFPEIFASRKRLLRLNDLRPDGWRLASSAELRLLEKLRAAGQPLGEYVQGRFYYGIKTGLNEAFVVDRATRDRLIAEHPSSAEVLKPFLRGRDVKRWRCEFSEKYLIKIESSENKQHPWSGKSKGEAERIFAKTYPAIHAWFETMRQALVRRYDQGHYFWELRSCDYWREFEQPKIIYPDIYEHQSFAWDCAGFFSANTTYFIPTAERWLTGLLNSSCVEWLYTQIANRVRGGYLRAFSDFIGQIPIPNASHGVRAEIESRMDTIVAKIAHDGRADVSALEREIDECVYRLYGLTPEEIKIVEEGAK